MTPTDKLHVHNLLFRWGPSHILEEMARQYRAEAKTVSGEWNETAMAAELRDWAKQLEALAKTLHHSA